MNAEAKDHAVDITAALEANRIQKVERFINRWLVRLNDGRFATGATVGEAFANACAPDAQNVQVMP